MKGNASTLTILGDAYSNGTACVDPNLHLAGNCYGQAGSTCDTAQYYSGRAFGRRPLAPAISPKKTVGGAVGGFVAGALVCAVVGTLWLPVVPLALRAAIGGMIVALGIAGDLFESMLKRGAGVKDSSRLIPGHGGILDRIDALLFAAPVYYVVLKYV